VQERESINEDCDGSLLNALPIAYLSGSMSESGEGLFKKGDAYRISAALRTAGSSFPVSRNRRGKSRGCATIVSDRPWTVVRLIVEERKCILEIGWRFKAERTKNDGSKLMTEADAVTLLSIPGS